MKYHRSSEAKLEMLFAIAISGVITVSLMRFLGNESIDREQHDSQSCSQYETTKEISTLRPGDEDEMWDYVSPARYISSHGLNRTVECDRSTSENVWETYGDIEGERLGRRGSVPKQSNKSSRSSSGFAAWQEHFDLIYNGQ